MLRGASKQRLFWFEVGLFVAWHTAAFTRAKRLKPWDQIQRQFSAVRNAEPTKATTRRKQTPAEMQAVFAAIAGQVNRGKGKGGIKP